jgi:hypothetical protein
MNEISGLASILAGANLHSIEEPPERDEFTDDASYERAYEDWQARITYWRAWKVDLPPETLENP